MPEQVPSQIGRYRIVGVVGPWMWGWVYRGRDETQNRDVWIKALASDLTNLPPFRQRFEREAKATAKQMHPNIITVFEFGVSEGLVFMVSEALEGETLLRAMNSGITLKAGLPIILQVLGGLFHIHESGIVHRQIRSANIFVCTDGHAKMMNFSLVTLIRPGVQSKPPDPLLATQFDLSPEIASGAACDGRSDLFSVGCLLYEMVTGQKPFRDESAAALVSKVITEEPDMALIPDGPEWKRLRGVITRALQKKPEDRYPDAGAMRADLELALEELRDSAEWSAPAPPSSHEEPIQRLQQNIEKAKER
jgi:serine/threonine protein kinase